VIVWSDGCAAQFKNGRAITYCLLDWLAPSVRVDYHFFCSCHGKGPCDGHAGHCKRMIRYVVGRGMDIRSRAALVGFLNSCKNSKAVEIASAADAGEDWKYPLPNLRSQHHFWKAPYRDNVIGMECMSNDPSGVKTFGLVKSARCEKEAVESGKRRCGNCFEIGHNRTKCSQIFSMSIEEQEAEKAIVREAGVIGESMPSICDDAPALAAAWRAGRADHVATNSKPRNATEREKRSECGFFGALGDALSVVAGRVRICQGECGRVWKSNSKGWIECDSCEAFAVCPTCKSKSVMRRHERTW